MIYTVFYVSLIGLGSLYTNQTIIFCFFFYYIWSSGEDLVPVKSIYQADIIEAFNSTSRYLDDLLNIDNVYFDQMLDRIYPTEFQLNRTNSSDTEAPFLDLNLCVSNSTVSTKNYDKRDDFDFNIVNFPFLDGDVPRRTSYGVYISQLIRFARASSNLSDFNYRDKALMPNFLGRAIVILNFVRRLRNFIADIVPC